MNVTTPTIDTTLPQELQNHIIKVKNMITLDEAEHIRLRGLIESQEYTITQLNNKEKALTDDIAGLTKRKQDLEEEIVQHTQALKNSGDELTCAYDELHKKEQAIESQGALMAQKQTELQEQEKVLQEQEARLAKRDEDITTKETTLREKTAVLEEALKKVC